MIGTTPTQEERDAAALWFLEDNYSEPPSWDDAIYGLASDWLILTDDEADERARDAIERDIWAFVPSFLANYMPEGIDEGILSAIAESKYEDAAPSFLRMIGDRLAELQDDAIQTDGRGHFLSSWDGAEHEFEYDGRTWYAYRN